MGDHFALLVNRLLTESTLHEAIESRNRLKQAISLPEEAPDIDNTVQKKDSSPKKLVECRICQDEDFDSNMESPCSCRGSLKYTHRRCVQRWCNEKGDTMCEICYQEFKPGYTSPPRLIQYGRIPLNFRGNWQIQGRALGNSPFVRMVPIDQVEDSDYDNDGYPSRTLRYLAVAIVFMVLLILRHTLPIIINGPDCCFPLLIVVALRVAGFVLLLYIIMLALVGLNRQHLIGSSNGRAVAPLQQRDQAELPRPFHVIQVE